MASGTAAPDYHSSLSATTVDTVTLPVGYSDWQVITDGTSRIDYTLDSSTPVVGGSPTGRALPAQAGYTDRFRINYEVGGTVKLISAATPHYDIEPLTGDEEQ